MMQITIAKISEQLSEKKKDYENLEIKIKKVKIEIDKKNEEDNNYLLDKHEFKYFLIKD